MNPSTLSLWRIVQIAAAAAAFFFLGRMLAIGYQFALAPANSQVPTGGLWLAALGLLVCVVLAVTATLKLTYGQAKLAAEKSQSSNESAVKILAAASKTPKTPRKQRA